MDENLVISIRSIFDNTGINQAIMAFRKLGAGLPGGGVMDVPAMEKMKIVPRTFHGIATATDAVSDSLKQVNVNVNDYFNSMQKQPLVSKNHKSFNNIVDSTNEKMHRMIVNQQNSIKSQISGFEQSSNAFRKMRGAMLGFGLSIMFFGMALKRLGDQITKSLVKTFMSATDETNVFHQQIMGLQAALEFLKFSIIDSIPPDVFIGITEALINIISLVGEFIGQHPAISMIIAAFLALAIVGGAFLMVIGQIFLLIVGIAGMVTMAGGWVAVWGTITAAASTFLVVLGIIAAVIAVVIALWVTDFGGFRDFIKKTWAVIKETIVKVWEGVKKVFTGVWDVITGILTGDWEKVWEGVGKVVQGAIDIVVALFTGMSKNVWNIFAWLVNGIVKMVTETMVGAFFDGLLILVRGLDWLAERIGFSLGFAVDSLEEAKQSALNFTEGIKLGYIGADEDIGKYGSTPLAGGSTTIVNNNTTVEINGVSGERGELSGAVVEGMEEAQYRLGGTPRTAV